MSLPPRDDHAGFAPLLSLVSGVRPLCLLLTRSRMTIGEKMARLPEGSQHGTASDSQTR